MAKRDEVLVSFSGIVTTGDEPDQLLTRRIDPTDGDQRDRQLDETLDQVIATATEWRRSSPTGRLVLYISLVPLSGQASIAIDSGRLQEIADLRVELHLDSLGR